MHSSTSYNWFGVPFLFVCLFNFQVWFLDQENDIFQLSVLMMSA